MFSAIRKLFSKQPEPELVEAEDASSGNLTIKAMSYDDESGQIKIDMDWDEAFVNYLKRNGFTGTSEEAIVQKYVATLYQSMVARQQEEGREYE